MPGYGHQMGEEREARKKKKKIPSGGQGIGSYGIMDARLKFEEENKY